MLVDMNPSLNQQITCFADGIRRIRQIIRSYEDRNIHNGVDYSTSLRWLSEFIVKLLPPTAEGCDQTNELEEMSLTLLDNTILKDASEYDYECLMTCGLALKILGWVISGPDLLWAAEADALKNVRSAVTLLGKAVAGKEAALFAVLPHVASMGLSLVEVAASRKGSPVERGRLKAFLIGKELPENLLSLFFPPSRNEGGGRGGGGYESTMKGKMSMLLLVKKLTDLLPPFSKRKIALEERWFEAIVANTEDAERELLTIMRCQQLESAEEAELLKGVLKKVEALPILIALLRDGSDSQKEQAARILGCIAKNGHNKELVARKGAIPGLVNLLRNGTNTGKEIAAETLRIIAYSNEENQDLIQEAGAIPLLVALLRDGTEGGKEQAAKALGYMMGNTEAIEQM